MELRAATNAKIAVRLSYFSHGFVVSCWAPLIPYMKARLSVDAAMMGILLLLISGGALLSTVIVGPLCHRYGCKIFIIMGMLGAGCILPPLSFMPTSLTIAPFLILFGVFFGILGVAENVHGVEIEKIVGVPLMSGFHGHFSVGTFAGSAFLTVLLSLGFSPIYATLAATLLVLVMVALAYPRLLPGHRMPGESSPVFVFPHGVVGLLALFNLTSFILEGSVLDWSALFITDRGLAAPSNAGYGFIAFSVAMTLGRLSGDYFIARYGDTVSLILSSTLAISGFFLVVLSSVALAAYFGFALVGLGVANIAPAVTRLAGLQSSMPSSLAISAVASIGCFGGFVGPAVIGFVANAAGLAKSFWMLTALACLLPIFAWISIKNTKVQNQNHEGSRFDYIPDNIPPPEIHGIPA